MESRLLSVYLHSLCIDVHHVRRYIQPPEERMDDYRVPFSSIGYILGGEGAIVLDGERFQPLPGELYLLPAGTLQSYYSVGARPYTKYYCHFFARVGSGSLFDALRLPPRVTVPLPEREEVIALYERLLAVLGSQDTADILESKALATRLLFLYVRYAGDAVCAQSDVGGRRADVEDTLRYMEENLDRPLSVEALAGRLFCSRGYFIRLFREATGQTPGQYLLRRRAAVAAERLLATAQPIADIARQTGFENPFYFSTVFKRLYGITPRDYRGGATQRREG